MKNLLRTTRLRSDEALEFFIVLIDQSPKGHCHYLLVPSLVANAFLMRDFIDQTSPPTSSRSPQIRTWGAGEEKEEEEGRHGEPRVMNLRARCTTGARPCHRE